MGSYDRLLNEKKIGDSFGAQCYVVNNIICVSIAKIPAVFNWLYTEYKICIKKHRCMPSPFLFLIFIETQRSTNLGTYVSFCG